MKAGRGNFSKVFVHVTQIGQPEDGDLQEQKGGDDGAKGANGRHQHASWERLLAIWGKGESQSDPFPPVRGKEEKVEGLKTHWHYPSRKKEMQRASDPRKSKGRGGDFSAKKKNSSCWGPSRPRNPRLFGLWRSKGEEVRHNLDIGRACSISGGARRN